MKKKDDKINVTILVILAVWYWKTKQLVTTYIILTLFPWKKRVVKQPRSKGFITIQKNNYSRINTGTHLCN